MIGGSAHPQKIALADCHAIMAQNAVGDRGVEVEMRESKAGEELLALQRSGFVGTGGKSNVAQVRAVELLRLERPDIVDGPGEPLASVHRSSPRGGRHLAMGEPRAGFGSEIAGELKLRFAVHLGLAEDAEKLQERRHSRVVEGHGMLFSCGGIAG